MRSALAALGLILMPTLAPADGRGVINEQLLGLEYQSPAYFVPNVTGEAGNPRCQQGTPTCDVFELTIRLSDAWRADPRNKNAYLDLNYRWDPNADYDIYLYDAAGQELGRATNFLGAGGDLLTLPLELLPDGQYRIDVIPYLPNGSPFVLEAAVTGIDPNAKKGLRLGGLGGSVLLPLLALAAVQMRRHHAGPDARGHRAVL